MFGRDLVRSGPVPSGSVQFVPVRFSPVRGSDRFCPVRFSPVRSDSVQIGWVWFACGFVRSSSIGSGSVWSVRSSGSVRSGSVRCDPVWRFAPEPIRSSGSARAGSVRCDPVRRFAPEPVRSSGSVHSCSVRSGVVWFGDSLQFGSGQFVSGFCRAHWPASIKMCLRSKRVSEGLEHVSPRS